MILKLEGGISKNKWQIWLVGLFSQSYSPKVASSRDDAAPQRRSVPPNWHWSRRTTVSRGIAFPSFAQVRKLLFSLKIGGSDWWQPESYQMEGSFQELRLAPGTINSSEVVDHGWLVMAQQDNPLDMSTDSSEGGTWHHLLID